METKHTRFHAETLAKLFYPTQTNDLICSPTLVRDAYVKGYMKAIEETAAHELLEALIEFKTLIDDEVIIIKENTDDDHANYIYNKFVNAIKKAVE